MSKWTEQHVKVGWGVCTMTHDNFRAKGGRVREYRWPGGQHGRESIPRCRGARIRADAHGKEPARATAWFLVRTAVATIETFTTPHPRHLRLAARVGHAVARTALQQHLGTAALAGSRLVGLWRSAGKAQPRCAWRQQRQPQCLDIAGPGRGGAPNELQHAVCEPSMDTCWPGRRAVTYR